jgi:hypothetical protein
MNFDISNHIYNQLDTSSNIELFCVDGLAIPFSSKWKRVGINLSGGADSACLLMTLCNIIIEQKYECDIHVISHIRCWNTRPWQGPIAKLIYDKFVADYPQIKFYRHTNYIPPEIEWGVLGPITEDEHGRPRSGDQIAVGSFNQYMIAVEKLDAVFNATSANPSDSNWSGGMKDREKTAKQGTLDDLIIVKNNLCVCHPFKFVEKNWIISQYHRQNKLDVYKLTRSCEGDLGHHKIKQIIPKLEIYNPNVHTVDNIPKCDDCWWCKEREWAEAQLETTLKDLNV